MSVKGTLSVQTYELVPRAGDGTVLGTFRFDYDASTHNILKMWDVNDSTATSILIDPSDPAFLTFGGASRLFDVTTEATNNFLSIYGNGIMFRATSGFVSKFGIALGAPTMLGYDVNRHMLRYIAGGEQTVSIAPTTLTAVGSPRDITIVYSQANVSFVNSGVSTTLYIVYDQFGVVRNVYDSTDSSTNLLWTFPIRYSNNFYYSEYTQGANNLYPLKNQGMLMTRPASFTRTEPLYRLANDGGSMARSSNNGVNWSGGGISISSYSATPTDVTAVTGDGGVQGDDGFGGNGYPLCFAKGMNVLCTDSAEMKIEDMKPGMEVKTVHDGTRKVKYVSRMKYKPDPTKPFRSLYRHTESGLVLTGMHAVIVPTVSKEVQNLYDEVQLPIERIQQDYLLHAAACEPTFERLSDDTEQDLYNIVVESDDPKQKFGVFVNGIACETMTIETYDHYAPVRFA
jgi:hypothetical protein